MSDTTKGVIAIIVACTVWGLSPLYYYALADVPPLELLSHRSLWSLVLLGLYLALQGRLKELPALMTGRTAFLVLLASVMISVNWGGFILSVQVGMVVEASLGYFIFPLIMATLGMLFFAEGLSASKLTAVLLATGAVLTLTIGLGVAPWLALLLGGTFATYSVIKKLIAAGPVVTVVAEVLFLAPLALIWLWGTHTQGWEGIVGRNGSVFGSDFVSSAMLIGSGLLTGGPLMLFSYASRRLKLSTVGVVQYLNPSLQFLCAVAILGETITIWHMIAFPLIWAALAIYSVGAYRQDRAVRKAATA
ncbi:EamA family transporter RarD [Aliiroseovarius marinus]|uniref:EamA family transporter RarD n=1 Tax=Aliiroseovarius marinus TaxID=2500159 RepID=UPI00105C2DD6|nr:EamA family transporter RarD [Aliiroseovarius marinus]